MKQLNTLRSIYYHLKKSNYGKHQLKGQCNVAEALHRVFLPNSFYRMFQGEMIDLLLLLLFLSYILLSVVWLVKEWFCSQIMEMNA